MVQYRGSISSPLIKWQPVPCCFFKKVESTGCKNYYRQHGKKKEEKTKRSDQTTENKWEEGGWLRINLVREIDLVGIYLIWD